MCGLVAVMDRQAPVSWDSVARGLATMAHRGPDGEGMVGITHSGKVARGGDARARNRLILGARRFSVLELSRDVAQPMTCPLTGNILVFSGEIYNFLELKDELANLGHQFKTAGDTEVILATYAQWGEGAFARLNGMWAMLLYEAESGDLIISRDRLGVKPLYYAQNGERHVFASEIRALLTAADKSVGLNEALAFDFLAGFETDHTNATLFDEVEAVPAGALWRLNKQGDMVHRRYHDWPEPGHRAAPIQHLRDLLRDSVRMRLRSDAPTVCLLSGGIDSALITWLAAEQQHKAGRTNFAGAFSYGYADDRYAAHDEIAQAMKLIKALPTPIEHTVVLMSPYPTLDELLDVANAQEMPTSTPSIMASWRLYQHIHARGIKVVLSGEGSDELFAGRTPRYMPLLLRDQLRAWQLRDVAALIRSPYLNMRDLLKALAWQLPDRYLLPLLEKNRANLGLMKSDFRASNHTRFTDMVNFQRLPLERRLREDVLHQVIPQKLRYSDRNSMRASVEVRLPFLDYRLVEYALGLPPEEKIDREGGKQILRKAFGETLPIPMMAKPKIHGFGTAEQDLVLEVDFASLLERAPASAWNYINRNALERALRKRRVNPQVWPMISFLLWITSWSEQPSATYSQSYYQHGDAA